MIQYMFLRYLKHSLKRKELRIYIYLHIYTKICIINVPQVSRICPFKKPKLTDFSAT